VREARPRLRALYERLAQKGKKPIAAIVAVMRKLITILNAMPRDAEAAETWQMSDFLNRSMPAPRMRAASALPGLIAADGLINDV
jgi:hypothetical protein